VNCESLAIMPRRDRQDAKPPVAGSLAKPCRLMLSSAAAGCPGKAMDMSLRIKRIYEPANGGGGKRSLVDRLWPRGISKN